MAKYDYDLFVVGAGSGGVRAARQAARSGAKVAVAEEYRVGGTCVIRGCVPKKLFVYAAEFSHAFKDAQRYGWTLGEVKFDWPTLQANVAQEVDRLSGIYAANLKNSGAELIHERAELIGPNAVRLASGREITAERILVATGGRPYRPLETPGQELGIVSDNAFLMKTLPSRVVVEGGGYIAVEFASIFHGLGVDTHLVYRGETVLRGFDEDLRTHIHAELVRQGVTVHTGCRIKEIARAGQGYSVRLGSGAVLEADLVMFAIGRVPHTEGLGLEGAGVETTEKGAVKVDEYSRTSVPSIYAVGDVTDRINLTPVAIREGQAFAETNYYGRPTAFDHADVPTAVFSHPPAASVGLTEAEARKRFGKADIYRTVFRPMKNTVSGNAARTLMKLVVHPEDERVLGVHIAGPDGPEMIQLAAVAVKAGLTKPQWDATCALHPTAAEELVTLKDKYTPPEAGGVG